MPLLYICCRELIRAGRSREIYSCQTFSTFNFGIFSSFSCERLILYLVITLLPTENFYLNGNVGIFILANINSGQMLTARAPIWVGSEFLPSFCIGSGEFVSLPSFLQVSIHCRFLVFTMHMNVGTIHLFTYLSSHTHKSNKKMTKQ